MKVKTVAAEERRSGELAPWKNRTAALGDGGRGCREGETVVVGTRMDAESRELLTWALVKVAEPGDRVVALHVLSDRRDSRAKFTSCSSLISLIRTFDAVLAAYEGFCNLKQIDLKLKICRGSSLRKVLVSEVNTFAATKLVLGVSRSGYAIGSSTSIAKYCAKKLPRQCLVLAVSNGRIIFQRESQMPSTATCHVTDTPKAAYSPRIIHQILHKNTGGNGRKDTGLETLSASSMHKCERSSGLSLASPKLDSSASLDGGEPQAIQPRGDLSSSPVRARPSFPSLYAQDLRDRRPGWPLLRRTGKMSVVQWAMSLPARHSTSAVEFPGSRPSRKTAISPPGVHDERRPSDTARREERRHPKDLESLQLKYSSSCRLFSYGELRNATANFSSDNLVGKGGCSRVFRGCLPDGKEIAVKILQKSEDFLMEFVSEVEIITALRHKNIISLYGFCFENDNFLLVYNYLSRGSLQDRLHGDKNEKASFGWFERYKVAMGLAKALDYLHGAGTAQPVIHRDVKSSNVLLSDDFEPRLSDFGLAKWASSTSSHITCNDVAGTFGYLAPEYFMFGKVDEKIDVYAYGVVLLELLTGRKPINKGAKGQESLVMWATPILQSGKAMHFLDPNLGDNYDNDQVERVILAAALCIRRAPRSRPIMGLVVQLLQGDEDIINWAKMQVNAAEDVDGPDDESVSPVATLQSHLSLALLDVESESFSESSSEHTTNHLMTEGFLEDYIRGRWSRSSSFD